MKEFFKILTISTVCNTASTFSKAFIAAQMNLKNTLQLIKDPVNLKTLGTSYLVSTIPALVGYGVGSMVDNGIAKQALSVVPALALTASAECLTDGPILSIAKPALNNFKLWTNKANVTLQNLKDTGQIKYEKYEMIDFANTFIQTELFNIFLPDAVDAPEVESDINIDLNSNF